MAVADAKKFVDLAHKDPKVQKKFSTSLDNVVKLGEKQGLHFTRADLQAHLRKRWGIKRPATEDEKDTCTICIL